MLTLLVWAYKESAAEVVRPLVAPLTVEAGTQYWPHRGTCWQSAVLVIIVMTQIHIIIDKKTVTPYTYAD